jgi:hypothetical protein
MSKRTTLINGGIPATSNNRPRLTPIDWEAVEEELLQQEKEERKNQPLTSPPEIAKGPRPTPDVRRYRLSEDGWSIEEDWDSSQKGTVPMIYCMMGSGTGTWTASTGTT